MGALRRSSPLCERDGREKESYRAVELSFSLSLSFKRSKELSPLPLSPSRALEEGLGEFVASCGAGVYEGHPRRRALIGREFDVNAILMAEN